MTPSTPEHNGGMLGKLLDRAQKLQAPTVAKYVAHMRAEHPDDTPTRLIKRFEDRFLTAVTGSGGAVGATAALPGVGTVAAIGAMGAETAFFVDAATLLTLATAEVYGIPIEDEDRRKALVLTVALGDDGIKLIRDRVGRKTSSTAALPLLAGADISSKSLKGINRKLASKFIKKFALKRMPLALGKVLPAGIGAVVGGAGNRYLGKQVISNSRKAFGPPPLAFPDDHKVPPLPDASGTR